MRGGRQPVSRLLAPAIAGAAAILWIAGAAATAGPERRPAGPAPAVRAVGAGPEEPVQNYELRVRPLLTANCLKCHGDSPRVSNLDLRTRAGMLAGGLHGAAIVPGNPQASRLYRRLAGLESPTMPPSGRLPARDIAAVRAWIEAGAPESESGWWASRKPQMPRVPALRDSWIRNPVDAFLLREMRADGLRPAPEAGREVLIRRATFDLLGLPPTPEAVAEFMADTRPDAYERLIDRLLASPRYGERWARHWLDLARYAESEGFKSDETRPNAWRYRDYVIQSLNDDKPYDRFLQEQIAGDELFPGDPDALVATGFNRHWADESNARNLRQRRQEILNDITDTVGSVMMGMTVGCARCHDHKYDPFSQRDYYRLQAFFAAVQPRDDLVLATPDAIAAHGRSAETWLAASAQPRAELERLEAPYRDRMRRDARDKFPDDVKEAIDTAPTRRTALQAQLAMKAEPQLVVTTDVLSKAMKGDDRKKWEELTARLEALEPMRPPDLPIGIGVTDIGGQAPPSYTLATGVFDAYREQVQPGFPSVFRAPEPAISAPSGLASTGRRAALARWLAGADHPLTARVMVNRIWQHHFGRGLVATESDFGNAGEPPTHPELLDWLAATFVRAPAPGSPDSGCGWRLKALHRMLMTSSAYRQSSNPPPAAAQLAAKVDPDNRLLWKMPRLRLEGEAIRDSILAVSGRLNPKMGGPSIFPELPGGLGTRGGWPVTRDPAERDRRSIYIFVRRNLRYPLFQVFDMPDTHEPCARRSVTTAAPQALMLLNNTSVLDLAKSFAARVAREAGPDRQAQIERAYRLALGRAPDPIERGLAEQFLVRQEPRAGGQQPALVDFCHSLLNLNEFIYVD